MNNWWYPADEEDEEDDLVSYQYEFADEKQQAVIAALPRGTVFDAREVRVRKAYLCADCGAFDWLGQPSRACYRADGLPLCWRCSRQPQRDDLWRLRERQDLYWRCIRCGVLYPKTVRRAHTVYPSSIHNHPWCWDCNSTSAPARACEQCSREFTPKRRDARFCSSHCRVTAHRARP